MKTYIAGLGLMTMTTIAGAHQSPGNCNGNGVNINIQRTPTPVIIGNDATYRVSVSNLDNPSIGLIACDADQIKVTFHCPGRDGRPTGLATVLATNLALPAGTPPMMLGDAIVCTILVDPGVTDAVAEVDMGNVRPLPLATTQQGTAILP